MILYVLSGIIVSAKSIVNAKGAHKCYKPARPMLYTALYAAERAACQSVWPKRDAAGENGLDMLRALSITAVGAMGQAREMVGNRQA